MKFIILVFFLIVNYKVESQAQPLSPVPGLAGKEINDLLVDKRGFLWVASDLGVYRYDGLSFVNFSNSHQASLAATGLAEDQQGRIWFNNFSGQIFYIENEVMKLLNAYNFKNESTFPQIALFQNQLVATTDRGLFTLNTANFQASYRNLKEGTGSPTNSLSVFKDKVIAFGAGNWYIYQPDGSFRKIPIDKAIDDFQQNVLTLHANTYQDTAYLTSNPSGRVSKLVVENDTIRLAESIRFDGFINSISIDGKDLFVNTRKATMALNNGKALSGFNVSAITTDLEGNQWYSSLTKGLLVKYKKKLINKIEIQPLKKNTFFLCLTKYEDKLLLGAQDGSLLLYDTKAKQVVKEIPLFENTAPVNSITALNQDEFIIGTSMDTYRVHMKTNSVFKYPNIKTIKQLDFNKAFLFMASAKGLFIVPRQKPGILEKKNLEKFRNIIKYDTLNKAYVLNKRSHAVCYYPEMASLFVAFKDGLYVLNKSGISEFKQQQKSVFATSLYYNDKKLFIGTVNSGLYVYDGQKTQNISIKEALVSKTIFKLKGIKDRLWIIGSSSLQLMDLKSLKIINNYDLPSREEADVTDVEEVNHRLFLTTSSGFFYQSFREVKNTSKPGIYLLSVKAGDEFLKLDSITRLDYSQNHLQFKIGIPSYANARYLYIKYTLAKDGDSTSQTSELGERAVNFSSLMPGKYTFKATIIDSKLGTTDKPVSFQFTISPPWWQSLSFKILVFFLVFLIVLYTLISYNENKLILERAFYAQQESIIKEKRRISSEIHDDIGSGLFAIQLFADQTAKKRKDVEELSQISAMMNDISAKIREVIWTTNVMNDTLENLIYYIQFNIEKLFEHTSINLTSRVPDEIMDLNINSQNRRNIYLIIKELSHNAIKHSKATRVDLTISFHEKLLLFVLRDNGVGFDAGSLKSDGMGLVNIQSRIASLKGEFAIENYKGTIVIIRIPLKVISNLVLNRNKSFWRIFSIKNITP